MQDFAGWIPVAAQKADWGCAARMRVVDVEFEFVQRLVESDTVIDEWILQLRLLPRHGDLIGFEREQVEAQWIPLWAIRSHDKNFTVSPVCLHGSPQDVREINAGGPLSPS
jgi:hypothetical protein